MALNVFVVVVFFSSLSFSIFFLKPDQFQPSKQQLKSLIAILDSAAFQCCHIFINSAWLVQVQRRISKISKISLSASLLRHNVYERPLYCIVIITTKIKYRSPYSFKVCSVNQSSNGRWTSTPAWKHLISHPRNSSGLRPAALLRNLTGNTLFMYWILYIELNVTLFSVKPVLKVPLLCQKCKCWSAQSGFKDRDSF